ncbi:predicted protein [Postia placenta Mad-698-R]|nr:predicted protein [Postia placenta Mad-698-R]
MEAHGHDLADGIQRLVRTLTAELGRQDAGYETSPPGSRRSSEQVQINPPAEPEWGEDPKLAAYWQHTTWELPREAVKHERVRESVLDMPYGNELVHDIETREAPAHVCRWRGTPSFKASTASKRRSWNRRICIWIEKRMSERRGGFYGARRPPGGFHECTQKCHEATVLISTLEANPISITHEYYGHFKGHK